MRNQFWLVLLLAVAAVKCRTTTEQTELDTKENEIDNDDFKKDPKIPMANDPR